MLLKLAIAHDDHAVLKILQKIVAGERDYALAWAAQKGVDAAAKCRIDRPDILLLDVALLDPNGPRIVCDIMKDSPCAILILSDAIGRQAGRVFEAMGCGALDAIATPIPGKNGSIEGSDALLKKLATIAKLLGHTTRAAHAPALPEDESRAAGLPALVAVGASTGGPKALAAILSALPQALDAAFIVCQHVDLQFANGLAQWLGSQTPLAVAIAEEGMKPAAGVVLVAGTNDHIILEADRSFRYTAEPRDYPYRPSINALFESIRKNWPRKDMAVLLTGMGRDGAEGLLGLRKSGWHTIVQDEATSIVFGMPAAAVELKAAVEIQPLPMIAGAILKKLQRKGTK